MLVSRAVFKPRVMTMLLLLVEQIVTMAVPREF
jgi:hypothetical protein